MTCAPPNATVNKTERNHWLAENPSKRSFERLMLYYQPVWISAVGFVVATDAYQQWGPWEYMTFSLVCFFPTFLLPLFFPDPVDVGQHLCDRYWVRANIWIATISFIGMHFWTQYFYELLGVRFSINGHLLNDVPVCLWFLTHCYFVGYFTCSSILIRQWKRVNPFRNGGLLEQILSNGIMLYAMGYVVAFGEAFTISSFPHYVIEDRFSFYLYGSAFYALAFLPSFPVYADLDEAAVPLAIFAKGKGKASKEVWSVMSLWNVFQSSTSTAMLVMILMEIWRLSIGKVSGEMREEESM